MKMFMGGLLMTILGVVIYNLAVEMIEEVMNFTITQINGVEFQSMNTPSISGFAGWILASVKLPIHSCEQRPVLGQSHLRTPRWNNMVLQGPISAATNMRWQLPLTFC